uniref:Putative ixodes 10 kDa peptide protein n=1 Tax=Ixodes ricinus TaxID=34613 RepID=A0A0K8RDF5_IXORI
MLLVLFAVVLLLPAFQAEGERFRGRPFPDPCYSTLFGGMDMTCTFHGHHGFKPNLETSCHFTCNGGGKYPLPSGVCEEGRLKCDVDSMKKLEDWKKELERRKKMICA